MKSKYLVMLLLLTLLMLGVASVVFADGSTPSEDPCVVNPLLPQCDPDGDSGDRYGLRA